MVILLVSDSTACVNIFRNKFSAAPQIPLGFDADIDAFIVEIQEVANLDSETLGFHSVRLLDQEDWELE